MRFKCGGVLNFIKSFQLCRFFCNVKFYTFFSYFGIILDKDYLAVV
jgi:hypothetical protein